MNSKDRNALLKETIELKDKLKSVTNWERNPVPLAVRAVESQVAKFALPSKFHKRRILNSMTNKLVCVSWMQDSVHLLSASQAGKLIIWNAFTGLKDQLLSMNDSTVGLMTCCFSPSDGLLAAGGLDNTASIYRTPTGDMSSLEEHKPLVRLEHDAYVSDIKFVNDEEVYVSSGDKAIHLWDVESGQSKHVFKHHTGDVSCIELLDQSGEGNVLISGSIDKTIKIWDRRVSNAAPLVTLPGHSGFVNCLASMPGKDGNNMRNTFASGSDDGTCRLWDMRAMKQLSIFASASSQGDGQGLNSISFSKSGRLLFTAYASPVCYIWDTIFGEALDELNDHKEDVSCVSTSPDGKAVATCSWDGTVGLWA